MNNSRTTVASAAGALLAGTSVWAARNPPPERELALTERINRLPAAGVRALYPIMQLGAGAAPVVVSGLVLAARRDPAEAAVIAVAGLGSWAAAKVVKAVVGRERPAKYLPRLHVREVDGSGLGFPSGHAAVAAAMATTIAAVLPVSRPVLATTAAAVGVARIVFGMHLPVDVVGGYALGLVMGVLTLAVAERPGSFTVGGSGPRESSC